MNNFLLEHEDTINYIRMVFTIPDCLIMLFMLIAYFSLIKIDENIRRFIISILCAFTTYFVGFLYFPEYQNIVMLSLFVFVVTRYF